MQFAIQTLKDGGISMGIILIPQVTTTMRYPAQFSTRHVVGCSGYGSNSIQLGSGNVQTWKDKSGNGNDVSQSAGGSRPSPANGLNGLQTLSFDGTHDHLESSTVNIPQPISLFTVLKLTGGSGDKRVITGQSSARRAILSMAETNKLSL